MKDNFSSTSEAYASYRPTYPDALVSYIADLATAKHIAWDAGTGNGQLALKLAAHFDQVIGTDLSANQLLHASIRDNIRYHVSRAEDTNFEHESIDLITVAQAVHWFEFDRFFAEVDRCLKPDGIIALIGYGRVRVNDKVDRLIDHFYWSVIGKFWDAERKYIDENYTTIPFPFDEFKSPCFEIVYTWSLNDFVGYLNTWSAVKHYISASNSNPVENLILELKTLWSADGYERITFPLFTKIGKKKLKSVISLD